MEAVLNVNKSNSGKFIYFFGCCIDSDRFSKWCVDKFKIVKPLLGRFSP